MIVILKLILVHAIRVRFNMKSVISFIYLNFFSKHVVNDVKKKIVIYPYPNCVFDLRDGSTILLEAPLKLGIPSIKNSKKSSYLFMDVNAIFKVKDESSIIDNYDIQIQKDAVLDMGHFHSNTGLEISCGEKIVLEGEVTCGRHVRIKDFNGHFVSYTKYPKSAPICIKNHTWLCTGSVIGPGVTVGEGAVISDNTIVIDNVPPKTFNSGNPSKVIVSNIEFKI